MPRPRLICHMLSPVDARVDPHAWSRSPDGTLAEWEKTYFGLLYGFGGKGYITGRVTMEPFAKGEVRAPQDGDRAARPYHFARPDAASYAITLDPSGRLHWSSAELDGDHLLMVLGPEVPDSHLSELAARGVSYIVSDSAEVDLAALLDTLHRELGVELITTVGGGIVNGNFFAAGLVDELSLVLIPALDGRGGARNIIDAGAEGLAGRVGLSFLSCDPLPGGALHLRYRVIYP